MTTQEFTAILNLATDYADFEALTITDKTGRNITSRKDNPCRCIWMAGDKLQGIYEAKHNIPEGYVYIDAENSSTFIATADIMSIAIA